MRRKTIPEVTKAIGVLSVPELTKGSAMFTVQFVKDATERALKTFAQSALATLGLGSVDVLSVNWVGVLSVGAGAAVISVLTSIASEPIGGNGTASLTDAVEPADGKHEAP